jgi:hypothetical protein
VKTRHGYVRGVHHAETTDDRLWRNCCPCYEVNRSVQSGAGRSDDLTNETYVVVPLSSVNGSPIHEASADALREVDITPVGSRLCE